MTLLFPVLSLHIHVLELSSFSLPHGSHLELAPLESGQNWLDLSQPVPPSAFGFCPSLLLKPFFFSSLLFSSSHWCSIDISHNGHHEWKRRDRAANQQGLDIFDRAHLRGPENRQLPGETCRPSLCRAHDSRAFPQGMRSMHVCLKSCTDSRIATFQFRPAPCLFFDFYGIMGGHGYVCVRPNL